MQLKANISQIKSIFSEKPLIKDIRFSIDRSGLIWIQGPNGSGKSVLSSAIAGKAYLDKNLQIEGDIALSDSYGNTYNLKSKHDVRFYSAHVSYLPQEFGTSLLAIHFQDDVCFGFEGKYPKLPGNNRKAKDIFAANKIYAICDQLELWTHLNKRSKKSSYGETRRIEVACALSPYPELIILDEPYSGLDGHWRQRLSQILEHYIETYNSIFIITSNVDSGVFGLTPDLLINLSYPKEEEIPFNIIAEKVKDIFSDTISPISELKIEGLSIKRKDKTAKSIINVSQLYLYPGIVNWIVGDNGSGKTTLLEVLSGAIYSSRFFGAKISGKLNGTQINKAISKAPNDEIRLLQQSPYDNFVYKTVLGDLDNYGLFQKNPNISSLVSDLSKYWNSLARKANAFSFGQLKYLQFLLLPSSAKVIFIDEPLLGVNPIFHKLTLETLEAIAKTGRMVIASIESKLMKKEDQKNYFELPSLS